MEVLDSRRLTGPNVLWDRPCGVLDVEMEAAESERAVAIWERHARRILAAVGWGNEAVRHRVFPGGASLAVSAPIDALYAATEVNEWAWEATAAEIEGGEPPDLAEAASRLSTTIAEESNPPLLALRRAAEECGVAFLSDDDFASVGLGAGSLTWPVGDLPDPDAVDWGSVHDIPLALVTGTNGKTTTVRLLAAMAEAAGRAVATSSTDWLRVAGETLDTGDYSGPGGARTVLRHRRAEIAILETARGGMLRRGLAVRSADVALITNVAEDHLGEFGVYDLEMLAEAKFVVARAARRLVLNADDPIVRRHGAGAKQPITWFSLDPTAPGPEAVLTTADRSCWLDGEDLVLAAPGGSAVVTRIDDIPIALGGAARHNVANALAAIAVAWDLRLPVDAMRRALAGFESTPEENPGRLNVFDVGGVRAIVDFAHNPHGVEALLSTAATLPAERRLITVGQAGDRDDAAIRHLAQTVWSAGPERVIVKEMSEYLRGRAEGETADLIESELRSQGAPSTAVGRADTEIAAARQAFEWARPGDLLLLITHSHRDEVLELIGRLQSTGWQAATPLPALL